MNRMKRDAGKDIREPDLRIDVIHLGRDDQAEHSRSASSAAIGSAEQPRFPAKSYTSYSPFGGIVGEAHTSVLKEQREARPSLQDVVERFGQIVPTGELGNLLPHVDLKLLDHRPAQRLPHL